MRVGLRPATPDGLPMIGPLRESPRVIAATGHFRNGVLLAPITAEIVAHHVLDSARRVIGGDVAGSLRVMARSPPGGRGTSISFVWMSNWTPVLLNVRA